MYLGVEITSIHYSIKYKHLTTYGIETKEPAMKNRASIIRNSIFNGLNRPAIRGKANAGLTCNVIISSDEKIVITYLWSWN